MRAPCRHYWLATISAFGLTLIGSATASAQARPDHRVAVAIEFGGRMTSMSFTQSITFEAFSEQGSLVTNYALKHSPFVDGGVTVRVWRSLGAGMAVSSLHDSFGAQITALIPHPIIANQPRTVTGDAPVTYREVAAHLQAVYWWQHGRRLGASFFGGPSVIRSDQDFVSDVSYSQTFPYNTASFEGATVVRQRTSATGFNAGGQVGWTIAGPFGITALARYSRVVNHFPTIGTETVRVGGLNLGAGLQLLF